MPVLGKTLQLHPRELKVNCTLPTYFMQNHKDSIAMIGSESRGSHSNVFPIASS